MNFDEIVSELESHRVRAVGSIEALVAFRHECEQKQKQLENPRAALEYIDFFAGLFTRAAEEVARIRDGVPAALERSHVDALRQLASNSALEQRRTVAFRDKWINKPLPYEDVRPLLTSISNATREQLDALRRLNDVAAALEVLMPTPEKNEPRGLDRRQLFTRLFKPDADPE